MTPHVGWTLRSCTVGHLWFKGYVLGVRNFDEFISTIAEQLADTKRGAEELVAVLESLRGHYAIVLKTPSRVVAAVDKVRSIPLFMATCENHEEISNDARRLPELEDIDVGAVDRQAALEIAMAGYTIGAKTLFRNRRLLQPGELRIWDRDKGTTIHKRPGYGPWRVVNRTREELIHELTERTHEIFREMIENLGGRQVVIPLSAGNDSRLVAAMLREYGYKNVLCISYGIPGNFEGETAKSVARYLGYRWEFIPLTLRGEREFYDSPEFQDYLHFADPMDAVPYFQGLSAIRALRDSGSLATDAVWVNGNSGDFISGGHTDELVSVGTSSPDHVSLEDAERAILDKHFSLWGNLRTRENDRTIMQEIRRERARHEREFEHEIQPSALFEHIEFTNRQCKYVIAGQRTYEYYGYEWRMPLWDDRYLEFWSGVELQWKLKQKLYVEMLRKCNFGGVWGSRNPVNRRTVRPWWIKHARNVTKIPFGLLGLRGKRAWHHFDRCVYYYLYDRTRMMCSVPYHEVIAACRKAPRHHVSFQVRRYLKHHGCRIKALD